MKNKSVSLLLHPLFIVCLGLLLLNDFYLKQQYHNFLTGKLSDFAGLACFALFISALLPNHKKTAFVSAALFFAWWKSSLSQPAINFFNYNLQFPVNRVVDYTDYMALTVLPMVYKLRHEGRMNFVHKLAAVVVAGVSLFAFCATTCRGYYPSRMSTEVYMYNSYKTTLTENQVFKRLDSLKLRYKKDSVKANEIYTYDSIFYLQKDSVTGITNRVVLPTKNTIVYARYKTSPFVEVYNVPAENEMIPVVTFGYFARKGKSRIEISSITLDSLQYSRYVKEPALERRYKKMLENLLIKQLQ